MFVESFEHDSMALSRTQHTFISIVCFGTYCNESIYNADAAQCIAVCSGEFLTVLGESFRHLAHSHTHTGSIEVFAPLCSPRPECGPQNMNNLVTSPSNTSCPCHNASQVRWIFYSWIRSTLSSEVTCVLLHTVFNATQATKSAKWMFASVRRAFSLLFALTLLCCCFCSHLS